MSLILPKLLNGLKVLIFGLGLFGVVLVLVLGTSENQS